MTAPRVSKERIGFEVRLMHGRLQRQNALEHWDWVCTAGKRYIHVFYGMVLLAYSRRFRKDIIFG